MRNHLVTGGAGFIGSAYLRLMTSLYPEDHFVCLDALTYAVDKKRFFVFLNGTPNLDFFEADIRDAKALEKAFLLYPFDDIVHFAAETHVDSSFRDPDLFHSTNVIGTKLLLEAATKHGVKRFHYVSTDEVYGAHQEGDGSLFKESDACHPNNPYSLSKYEAELLLLSCKDKMHITISRGVNTYGANQYKEKLIPMCVDGIKKKRRIPVYGDGKQRREWIHVDDHARAIVLILEKGEAGEIYNIGSGEERRNIDLVKDILEHFGLDEGWIEFVPDRKNHDFRYGVSSEKLKALGFLLKARMSDRLAQTLDELSLADE